MGTIKIIIGVLFIVYYLILFLVWVVRQRFFHKYILKEELPIKKTEKNNPLVGKSTFKPQSGNFGKKAEVNGLAQSKVITDHNNANTFVPEEKNNPESSGEVLNIDIELGYDNGEQENELSPEEMENEEIRFHTGNEPKQGQGYTYEDMQQVINVLRKEKESDEKEIQTMKVLSEIQQTSLFNNIVDGIHTGRQRISQMMNKHDIVIDLPEAKEDLSSFNLSNYM